MSEYEQHATQLERLIGMTEVLGALDSDEIRAALAAGAAALREIDTLRAQLAECYRLTGADPDGNEDAMLAPHAVDEVRRLRMDGEKSSELLELVRAQTIAEVKAAGRVTRQASHYKGPMIETLSIDVAELDALACASPKKGPTDGQ